MRSLPHVLSTLLLPSSLAVATACGDARPVDLGGDYQIAAIRARTVNPDVDVLFVVDNSGSMADENALVGQLAEAALLDVISQSVRQDLNLHVGVITSDLGCGSSAGDDAELQAGDGCLTDGVPYIYDVADGAGGRLRNTGGDLSGALACLTSVGTQGCGFEQPLGAVTRFLAHADAGQADEFLRPDALLVVVLLTDEDDCTAQSNALFDAADEPWGPRDSFRCFDHGVICAEPDNQALGVHTQCTASADDALLRPIDGALDALIAAKGGDASRVFVATVTGGTEPVEVIIQGDQDNLPGWRRLAPSCIGPGTAERTLGATPAIRLHDLTSRMAGHAWEDSICAVDLTPALRRTGAAIGDLAGQRACLQGNLVDIDERNPGTQPACRAFALLDGSTTPVELPACGVGAQDQACFTVAPDAAACGHTAAAQRAELVLHDQPAYATALITYECLTTESIAAE